MPTFHATVTDAHGAEKKVKLDADNEEIAIADLKQRGFFVSNLVRAKTPVSSSPTPTSAPPQPEKQRTWLRDSSNAIYQILVLGMLGSICFHVSRHPNSRWDYEVVSKRDEEIEDTLTLMGHRGYELINVRRVTVSVKLTKETIERPGFELFFKRPY
jgi:hypothetical protein